MKRSVVQRSGLALILVAAGLGLPASASEPLFCIGNPDGFASEFALVGEGYAAFSRVFGDSVEYTIGKNRPSDWPFVHPAHRDKWAGSSAHPFTIRFNQKAGDGKPVYLLLGLAGAHSSERSKVTVCVNGSELPAQTAPATGAMEVVFDPRQKGNPETMIFEIPAGELKNGENAISVRLDDQSWILYDYVALTHDNKPLPIGAPQPPDLLSTFSEGPMAGVEEIVFAVRKPGLDGHWYANFGYYADDENRITYQDGGRLCRMNLKTGKVQVLLEDEAGAVRDPQVHYDAERIVFSYRPGGTEYYHLYEINVDGTGLRQLTDGPYDDIEPTYLADGDLVFVSSRCKRWVNCWLTKVAVLHRCGPDGEDIHAISANLEHDNTPWPLHDGRILYQRWEYIDRSQVDYHHLWTANPDGTGEMVYYGNMHPSTLMIDAKPIEGTKKIVSIFSPGHGRREHEGTITVVDPSGGPDEQGLATPISQTAEFRDPWGFSSKAFMAAHAEKIVLMDDAGRIQPIFTLSREEAKAGFRCHEPRPLIARPRERAIPARVRPEMETGRLVLMDVYEGRNMADVERGEIKKLLVLEALPKPINFTGGMDPLTYGGSFTLERVLGTVPVEADGSAHVELPAMRSLFFVALDENDMAVKRMQSFLTVRPGEVTGCVGCHEQRNKTFIPGGEALAMQRRVSTIETIDDCPDVFDYPRDIQPILNRLCTDCHGYEKTDRGGPYAGGVILTGDRGPMFSHSYVTMTVRELFVDGRDKAESNYAPRTIGSSASRILNMLDGDHYGVKATDHEKKMLRLWIEVGAPYPGTYAALGCGSIGGYAQNQLVNTDTDWPTTQAGAEVIKRRCAGCHQGEDNLPKSMSDEIGISFWRFDIHDPRLQFSRHLMFNLSRPEKSLIALAPLATTAGGLGLCRNGDGDPVQVFADRSDGDYQKLVAMAAAGKRNLDEIKRFDMPDFRPRPQYVREMIDYGVLPTGTTVDSVTDPYAVDRRYWQSLWHQPE